MRPRTARTSPRTPTTDAVANPASVGLPGQATAYDPPDAKAGHAPAALARGRARVRAQHPTAVPPERGKAATDKLPSDIDEVMARVRAAVADRKPAAMFQLYDEGYRSVFEILVS